MTEPDIRAQAFQFVVQALNDLNGFLPASARPPFIQRAQAAITALEPQAEAKPE